MFCKVLQLYLKEAVEYSLTDIFGKFLDHIQYKFEQISSRLGKKFIFAVENMVVCIFGFTRRAVFAGKFYVVSNVGFVNI